MRLHVSIFQPNFLPEHYQWQNIMFLDDFHTRDDPTEVWNLILQVVRSSALGTTDPVRQRRVTHDTACWLDVIIKHLYDNMVNYERLSSYTHCIFAHHLDLNMACHRNCQINGFCLYRVSWSFSMLTVTEIL